MKLLLFLLLRFLGLLGGRFRAFLTSFLLALLDNLGLGSDSSFGCNCFRRGHNFFLHRDYGCNWLVRIGQELKLVPMRKFRYTQHLAEDQFAYIRLDECGNIAWQALDFDFAKNLLENAALLLYAGSLALEDDRNIDGNLHVHGDALKVYVKQRPFNRLVLPVNDHCLGALATVESQIKNGVVASLRMQNARHLARIKAYRHGVFTGAIQNSRDFAFATHAACIVLGASRSRLGFQ